MQGSVRKPRSCHAEMKMKAEAKDSEVQSNGAHIRSDATKRHICVAEIKMF